MARSFHFKVRKAHRYLGLILGIQFLLWTVGGIYFSYSNMDEIHGDLQRKPAPFINGKQNFISPAAIINALQQQGKADSISDLKLIEILGRPYYQIVDGPVRHSGVHAATHRSNIVLADALTGQIRGPLTATEAVAIAKSRFNEAAGVKEVRYLTAASSHHEYRESPLPAYAVTFAHRSNTTVYISAELGTVQKFRNDKWRIFDLLWMLHTMDYQGRDNIGNILLRVFSLFGLITILSGFVLYYLSSLRLKSFRKKFSPGGKVSELGKKTYPAP